MGITQHARSVHDEHERNLIRPSAWFINNILNRHTANNLNLPADALHDELLLGS